MPILESHADHSAIHRNLLAASWGIVLGLFFGLPPAWAAHGMGLPWLPYGTAVITIGLVVGLLIAFTVEALFPRDEPESGEASTEAQPSIHAESRDRPVKTQTSAIRRRLAEAKASLESLDAQRKSHAESDFGKAAEERIVWNELLELELQDVDEQIRRIRAQTTEECQ